MNDTLRWSLPLLLALGSIVTVCMSAAASRSNEPPWVVLTLGGGALALMATGTVMALWLARH